jgi:hypothetical protein
MYSSALFGAARQAGGAHAVQGYEARRYWVAAHGAGRCSLAVSGIR